MILRGEPGGDYIVAERCSESRSDLGNGKLFLEILLAISIHVIKPHPCLFRGNELKARPLRRYPFVTPSNFSSHL